MVIRKDDRVATVLRHDESLIDVFIELSPAFERLRHPSMRKVMARLVTVEQAARMARVDADELVARLNAGGAADPASSDPASADPPSADPASDDDPLDDDAAPPAGPVVPSLPALPAALTAIPGDRVVEADVREDLRNGVEPFARIMAARREVPPGGALVVRAIFEPVPLYAVLGKQGLAHHTEQLAPDDWRVWFYERVESAAAAEAASPADTGSPGAPAAATSGADATSVDDDVVVLDVRGMEPPEPMVATLEALEALPPDATLVQLNVRVPQFLLPQLDERGFTYEIREQEPGLVRVFIQKRK